MNDEKFMREAIELSMSAVAHGNEPFGAVLVKDDEVVFSNENQIYTKHDPTYHGEAGLIRDFCAQTGITDLSKYTLYSSCEPCFMCSGAMVWTKLGRLVYAASNDDLEKILGNDGAMIGTYYWFKEALKTQNMKLAVIEIKSAGRSSEKAEEKARKSYDYMKWGKNKIQYALDYKDFHKEADGTDEEVDLWSYLFPLSLYHTRWSELS